MMKEVLRALDTGVLAQIGLIAFVFAFLLVLLRVFLYTKQEISQIENLPFTPEFEVNAPSVTNGHTTS